MVLVTSHCLRGCRIHSLVTSSWHSSNSKSKRNPTACSEECEIQLEELTACGEKSWVRMDQLRAYRRKNIINLVRQLPEYFWPWGWGFAEGLTALFLYWSCFAQFHKLTNTCSRKDVRCTSFFFFFKCVCACNLSLCVNDTITSQTRLVADYLPRSWQVSNFQQDR